MLLSTGAQGGRRRGIPMPAASSNESRAAMQTKSLSVKADCELTPIRTEWCETVFYMTKVRKPRQQGYCRRRRRGRQRRRTRRRRSQTRRRSEMQCTSAHGARELKLAVPSRRRSGTASRSTGQHETPARRRTHDGLADISPDGGLGRTARPRMEPASWSQRCLREDEVLPLRKAPVIMLGTHVRAWSPRAEGSASFAKTKWCRFATRRSTCPNPQCNFAHTADAIRACTFRSATRGMAQN